MKYISTFLFFITTVFGATEDSPFTGWKPANPRTPIKQTFFHRSKAGSPVFLEVVQSGSPSDLNLSIRKHHGLATDRHTDMHALLQNDDQCPLIGMMWLQFRKPDNVHLVSFSVQTPHRSQGYGAHDLITALSMLKKRDFIRTVTLSIKKERENASPLVDFYQRFGFKRGILPTTGFVLDTHQEMFLDLKEFNPTKPGLVKNEPRKN